MLESKVVCMLQQLMTDCLTASNAMEWVFALPYPVTPWQSA